MKNIPNTPIPVIRKITTPELQAAVSDAAKEDCDNMTFPTHVVYKNGEIVGGWNIGGLPLLLCWHDSDKVKARDSMHINQTVDSMMNAMGHKAWWMACNSHSPYFDHIQKFDYQPVWPTNMYVKQI